MTHTPGPWNFTKRQEIFAPNGKSADGTKGVTIGEVHGDFNYPEDLANARLIAAAPDLLAALEELRDYMGPTCEDDDRDLERAMIARADAAIAKALS